MRYLLHTLVQTRHVVEYKNWDIFHFSISKDIIMIYAYPHSCESVDFNYLVLENKKWFRADECFFN